MLLRIFIFSVILGGTLISTSYGQGVFQDTSAKSSIEEDSIINIPFGKVLKRNSVSDLTVINPRGIETFDHVVYAQELTVSRVPGLEGSSNIRGLGGALVVIDGVPNSLSFINANEIAQITVLKDANASILYGVQGSNGVILITTKRGVAHKNTITSTIETGSNRPISYPQYLRSAEYMGLYNEALANDGLSPLYSSSDIQATKNGTDPIQYPDVDYYSSYFLKNSKPDSRFQTEFSGGNDNAQYYLNVGWLHSGSIMTLGNQHNDRLNLRTNIDLKINSFIKANIGVAGIFNIAKTTTGNFFSDASSIRPNAFPGLIDTSLVSDENLIQGANLVNGKYFVGGTTIYQSNPYGYLNSGGYNNIMSSAVEFNDGLDFDLRSIAKGLSFKVNFIFDYNNNYTTSVANSYAVYEPDYSSGSLDLTKIGIDRKTGVQNISASYLNRKITLSESLNYQRVFHKDHAISASIIGFADKYDATDTSIQGNKHANLGSRINYIYKNRYIFDFNSALVSSAKLAPTHRVAYSPSLGLGWVLSNENFLQNSSVINFLKLRVSGGIINTDMNINGYYLYENLFQSGSGYFWNNGILSNTATVLAFSGNSNLFYEKTKEVNIGFNSILFNRTIWVDATVFMEYKSDLVEQLNNTIPDFTGGINPLQNYGENKYSGVELGISWKKSVNNFNIDIGTSMLFTKSEVIKTDEFWANKYLYRAGKSTSAIYALQAVGFFKDAADIANSPTQQFGPVQPGDIKYKDQNHDGVINADDQVMVGRSAPSFVGGLTVKLEYKNFTLFAIGSVQSGSDAMATNSYYWLYGDEKYSVLARGAWTPATSSTATYPRLSTLANANDFTRSSFWLYNNSQITLDRIQLTYDTNTKFASKFYAKNLNFYLRAENIADFSKNRDKQQLNIGVEPQYKYYAVGLTVQF